MRIAVFSDLHVGDSARSQDLSPLPRPTLSEKYFRRDLCRYIKRDPSLRADFLICPGDASDGAHPDEFSLASDFLLEIAEALEVNHRRVLFVPGNHDTNWDMCGPVDADIHSKEFARRYAPLKSPLVRLGVRRGQRGAQLIAHPPVASWTFGSTTFIGLNSSWYDRRESRPHHGTLDRDTLSCLDETIASLRLPSAQVKVAIVHHHPFQYDVPGSPADFSALQRAHELVKILSKHRFDFLIHGHMHVPFLHSMSVNGGHPLVVLGAGSVCVSLPAIWSGTFTNQFHIIDAQARHPGEGILRGQVLTYANNPVSGWHPSRQSADGLPFSWGFGHASLPHVLEAKIRSALSVIRARGRSYAMWPELLEIEPSLRYVPSEPVIAMLKLVCTDLQLTLISEDGLPTTTILWPEP